MLKQKPYGKLLSLIYVHFNYQSPGCALTHIHTAFPIIYNVSSVKTQGKCVSTTYSLEERKKKREKNKMKLKTKKMEGM